MGTLAREGRKHGFRATILRAASAWVACLLLPAASAFAVGVDTTPPVISACAPDTVITADANCMGSLPDLTSMVAATDDSGTVTITQSPVPGTLVGAPGVLVTFTATDPSSNSVTCTANVTLGPDVDDDGTPDCNDGCPSDPNKI